MVDMDEWMVPRGSGAKSWGLGLGVTGPAHIRSDRKSSIRVGDLNTGDWRE